LARAADKKGFSVPVAHAYPTPQRIPPGLTDKDRYRISDSAVLLGPLKTLATDVTFVTSWAKKTFAGKGKLEIAKTQRLLLHAFRVFSELRFYFSENETRKPIGHFNRPF